MKKYKIFIEADILSSLLEKDLEERLVIALYEIEKEQTIYDGKDNRLIVIDYIKTETDEM